MEDGELQRNHTIATSRIGKHMRCRIVGCGVGNAIHPRVAVAGYNAIHATARGQHRKVQGNQAIAAGGGHQRINIRARSAVGASMPMQGIAGRGKRIGKLGSVDGEQQLHYAVAAMNGLHRIVVGAALGIHAALPRKTVTLYPA